MRVNGLRVGYCVHAEGVARKGSELSGLRYDK